MGKAIRDAGVHGAKQGQGRRRQPQGWEQPRGTEVALSWRWGPQGLTVALPHVLHRDELPLPARDGLQLALVPVGDTIGATHLAGRWGKA